MTPLKGQVSVAIKSPKKHKNEKQEGRLPVKHKRIREVPTTGGNYSEPHEGSEIHVDSIYVDSRS